MTKKIDYTFSVDGFYQSINYYRSEATMNPSAMPAATATGITELSYSDNTAVVDKVYYVRFGSVKNGIEKISEEVIVDTSEEILIFEITFPKITTAYQVTPVNTALFNKTNARGLQASRDGLIGSIYGTFSNEIEVYSTTSACRFGSSNTTLLGKWSDASKGTVILSLCYFGEGKHALVVHNGPWSVTHYKLNTAFRPDLGMTQVETLSALGGTSSGSIFITPDGLKMFRYAYSGFNVQRFDMSKLGLISSASLVSTVDISAKLSSKYSGANVFSGIGFSTDGLKALACSYYQDLVPATPIYSGGRIISLALTSAFDLTTATQSGYYAPDDTLPATAHPVCVVKLPGSSLYDAWIARQVEGFHTLGFLFN